MTWAQPGRLCTDNHAEAERPNRCSWQDSWSAARQFTSCLPWRKMLVPFLQDGEPRVERNARGHWLPGQSANPGGRPGLPEEIKATLRELSPRAVERLGELLDSQDERIRLEAAKAILDRHLGRPAIQADISLRGGA